MKDSLSRHSHLPELLRDPGFRVALAIASLPGMTVEMIIFI